jgi:hypothetical protein
LRVNFHSLNTVHDLSNSKRTSSKLELVFFKTIVGLLSDTLVPIAWVGIFRNFRIESELKRFQLTFFDTNTCLTYAETGRFSTYFLNIYFQNSVLEKLNLKSQGFSRLCKTLIDGFSKIESSRQFVLVSLHKFLQIILNRSLLSVDWLESNFSVISTVLKRRTELRNWLRSHQLSSYSNKYQA